jgi:hypothetical protein
MGKRKAKKRSNSTLKTTSYFKRFQVKFARRRIGRAPWPSLIAAFASYGKLMRAWCRKPPFYESLIVERRRMYETRTSSKGAPPPAGVVTIKHAGSCRGGWRHHSGMKTHARDEVRVVVIAA